jgi:mono/diheme cytochrome c family protein
MNAPWTSSCGTSNASCVKCLKPILALGLAILLLGHCGSPFSQGESLYKKHCAPCHMDDGSGLAALIPPLAGADYLQLYPERLPCIVVNGLEGPVQVNGQTYNQPMPGIADLKDVEIANILNYIQHRWGDASKFYSPRQIRQLLEDCSR